MMIPDPGVVLTELVRRTAGPGVTESDVIRWAGVAVGTAGVVLAIPDGMAAAWHWVKSWRDRASAVVRRVLRRPRHIVGQGGLALSGLNIGGRAHGHRWQPWREDATGAEQIDILHQQIEIMRELIYELRGQADRTAQDLRNEIRDAEGRVIEQLRQLASEIRGERSQASRVDARGFGPIALGIIMTGLPDGLAAVPALGGAFVVVAVAWTAWAFPGWLRDYKQALKSDRG